MDVSWRAFSFCGIIPRMSTPQQELDFLRPAFLNLFEDPHPDLARFIRLVINVLDPGSGYGPHKCAGDGVFLPPGCGKTVVLQTYWRNGKFPEGVECPECGAHYPFVFTKGLRHAPQRVILTKEGSCVGQTSSESDSGIKIRDTSPVTVTMPG